MSPETPYDLPNGDRVWVIDTQTAALHLGTLVDRFREGHREPLIFGDGGRPEGVVISWDEWAQFDAWRIENDGLDHVYDTARERLADNPTETSVPLEEMASELGWDVDERRDDRDRPRP